jgi:hypothetical protein
VAFPGGCFNAVHGSDDLRPSFNKFLRKRRHQNPGVCASRRGLALWTCCADNKRGSHLARKAGGRL